MRILMTGATGLLGQGVLHEAHSQRRRARLAALDALFFWLYGLGADDAAYVMAQFPIVREQDERAFGRFRTCEDVLDWLRHVV